MTTRKDVAWSETERAVEGEPTPLPFRRAALEGRHLQLVGEVAVQLPRWAIVGAALVLAGVCALGLAVAATPIKATHTTTRFQVSRAGSEMILRPDVSPGGLTTQALSDARLRCGGATSPLWVKSASPLTFAAHTADWPHDRTCVLHYRVSSPSLMAAFKP